MNMLNKKREKKNHALSFYFYKWVGKKWRDFLVNVKNWENARSNPFRSFKIMP